MKKLQKTYFEQKLKPILPPSFETETWGEQPNNTFHYTIKVKSKQELSDNLKNIKEYEKTVNFQDEVQRLRRVANEKEVKEILLFQGFNLSSLKGNFGEFLEKLAITIRVPPFSKLQDLKSFTKESLIQLYPNHSQPNFEHDLQLLLALKVLIFDEAKDIYFLNSKYYKQLKI
jgi:hypothetical protein